MVLKGFPNGVTHRVNIIISGRSPPLYCTHKSYIAHHVPPNERRAVAKTKRIMFGNLEGAVRRGQGGKEKEWTDCVQSDIRAFGITGDWKTMALKAEVWVEAVTKGGRRFMTAWREEKRKTRPDIARRRERQRDWESCNRTRKQRRILRSDTRWPSRRVVGIFVRTRDGPRPPA